MPRKGQALFLCDLDNLRTLRVSTVWTPLSSSLIVMEPPLEPRQKPQSAFESFFGLGHAKGVSKG